MNGKQFFDNPAALGVSIVRGLVAHIPPDRLTGVGENEIIATNRPRHPWIPAYAGMIEWA